MNIKGLLSLLHENPAYLKDPLPAVLVYYHDAETKEENLFKHVKKILIFILIIVFVFCFHSVISNKGLHLKHLNYLPHF